MSACACHRILLIFRDQAYISSDGADYRGSRKVTLGLLSGSLLPIWSALEKTVVTCRAEMSKAEQALKVCVCVFVLVCCHRANIGVDA